MERRVERGVERGEGGGLMALQDSFPDSQRFICFRAISELFQKRGESFSTGDIRAVSEQFQSRF